MIDIKKNVKQFRLKKIDRQCPDHDSQQIKLTKTEKDL